MTILQTIIDMKLLLRLRTGSHLYGLNHKDSDEDWLEIWDKCKPSQSFINNQDITRWNLSMFMRVADKGGHNALEVLMARHSWCDVDLLKDFRESYIASGWVCMPKFQSAMKTLESRGDQKGIERSAMLSSWLDQIFETGRFNPHND